MAQTERPLDQRFQDRRVGDAGSDRHAASHVSFPVCRCDIHRNCSRHTLHTYKTSSRLGYSPPPSLPPPRPAGDPELIMFFPPASGSESEASPEKRPRTDGKDGNDEEARGTPKQKNRRRCYRCQTKLELVQQELGSCRCGA